MNTSTADRERHLLDGAILEWDGERLTLTLSRAQIIWWCKFASREGEHGSPFTISFGPDGDVSIYIYILLFDAEYSGSGGGSCDGSGGGAVVVGVLQYSDSGGVYIYIVVE